MSEIDQAITGEPQPETDAQPVEAKPEVTEIETKETMIVKIEPSLEE